MRTILILRGLPGSGKTTYANEFIKNEPSFKRVNKDHIRLMLDNGLYTKQNEKVVVSVQEDLIRKFINDGFNVIVDNTNLIQSTVNQIYKIASDIGDVCVVEHWMNVTVEECLERNSKREGSARVLDSVITIMASKHHVGGRRSGIDKTTVFHKKEITYDNSYFDGRANSAIVCDLDGTLALLNGRDPYNPEHCDKDLPNPAVVGLVMTEIYQGTRIIFCSGREERYREQTVKFINRELSLVEKEYKLFMRPTGDSRNDAVIKREIFEREIANKYYVKYILDDRDRVVKMYRQELGLTVFQVNYGNF